MGYFPDGTIRQNTGVLSNPMLSAVRGLSVSAKRGMYAAAKAGIIARKTWNGCAFNRASGGVVESYEEAAKAFDMSIVGVQTFIRAWDDLKCGDEQARRYLIEALEHVGVCTPAGHRGVRVVKGFAYKSAATKFTEQLDSGELRVEDIPGCEAIADLMSSCSA